MNHDEGFGALRRQRLEDWIAHHGDAILRTCFVYLADRGQAEDAMQDTFLKAWKAMEQFEGRNQSSEKTWLMRIAINTCRDYQRSKWLRHVDMSKVLEDIPLRDVQSMPQEQALFCDIMKLPEKFKRVILLYYYQEMTLKEVAETLQIHPSAVYRRLQKAQALLKCSLGRGDFDA